MWTRLVEKVVPQSPVDQAFMIPVDSEIELVERVARVFVEQLLASEPGQILRLGEAYETFRRMLKQKELPDIKRSDFRAVVGPMITSHFNVSLRNDLPGQDGAGVCGWKRVRLVQTLPG